jgi:hypothetical protein
MNSKSIYQNLCQSRSHLVEAWKPGSGLARHRILPGHQGGTYEEGNCTYLTHREHILAHYLLWRINGHKGDLNAWQMMKGIKSWPTRLGTKTSEETKKKISESLKGKVPWNKGKTQYRPKGIKHSEETKKKLSEQRKGKKLSKSHRQAISDGNSGANNAMYGKTHSQESKDKIRKKALGRKVSDETRKKMSEAQKKRQLRERG